MKRQHEFVFQPSTAHGQEKISNSLFQNQQREIIERSFETGTYPIWSAKAITSVTISLYTTSEVTRDTIVTPLLQILDDTEATQYLLDWLRDLWQTTDLLKTWFGQEAAQHIIDAPMMQEKRDVQDASSARGEDRRKETRDDEAFLSLPAQTDFSWGFDLGTHASI